MFYNLEQGENEAVQVAEARTKEAKGRNRKWAETGLPTRSDGIARSRRPRRVEGT